MCAATYDGLELLYRRVELRIRCRDEVLRLFHKGSERAGIIETGGRFYINRVRIVGVVIEYLFLQSIGFGGETVSERASRGCRR